MSSGPFKQLPITVWAPAVTSPASAPDLLSKTLAWPPHPSPTGRASFFRGTVLRATCTKCADGYKPSFNGRACWCARGFAWDGSSCQPCGNDFW